MVKITELALTYGIKPQKVRRILRNHGISRKTGQWVWREESKALGKVQDILKLYLPNNVESEIDPEAEESPSSENYN